MNIGRASTFSTAVTRIIAAILLAGFIPGAAACWIGSDGLEYCINPGYVACSVAFFILFLMCITLSINRRRRIARANQALKQQAPQVANASANVNQGPYRVPPQDVPPPQGIPPQGSPSPQVTPQYPPQVHNGVASPYMASVSQSATLPPKYDASSPSVASAQV
jgi:hypothetical protein